MYRGKRLGEHGGVWMTERGNGYKNQQNEHQKRKEVVNEQKPDEHPGRQVRLL